MEINEGNKNEKLFCFENDNEGRSIFGNFLNSSYKPNTQNTLNFFNDLCSTEKNSKLEESIEYSTSHDKFNHEKVDLELIEKSKLSIPSSNNSNLMMFNKTSNEPKAFIRESPLIPIVLYSKNSQAVLKDFLCCICSGVVVSAVVDSCNHLFCKPCILEYQSMIPQKNNYFFNYITCPTNRTSQININRVPFVDNIIKKHLLICKNHKDFGCKWNGNAKEYLSHAQYCDKERVICTLNDNKDNYCKWQGLRENIEAHQKECLFRIIFCKYCNFKMTFCQLSDHNLVCKEIPQICNICKKQFPRKILQDHLIECNKTSVKELFCPFDVYGCKGVIKSDSNTEDIENHLYSNKIFHLKIQGDFIKTICNNYDDEINKILIKNNELQKKLNDQERIINEILLFKENTEKCFMKKLTNTIEIAPQFNYNFIGRKLKSKNRCIGKKIDNNENRNNIENIYKNKVYQVENIDLYKTSSIDKYIFSLINLNSKILDLVPISKFNSNNKCSSIFEQFINTLPKKTSKIIFKIYIHKDMHLNVGLCSTSYLLKMFEKSNNNRLVNDKEIAQMINDSTLKLVTQPCSFKKGNSLFFVINSYKQRHVEIYKNDNLLHDINLDPQNPKNVPEQERRSNEAFSEMLDYFPVIINDLDENYHVELLI